MAEGRDLTSVKDETNETERILVEHIQSVKIEPLENLKTKCTLIIAELESYVSKLNEDKQKIKQASCTKYEFKLKLEVNVRMENGLSRCEISDICQLPDGTIILTELHNKMIMMLDDKYNLKYYSDLGAYPKGICCTGNTEVAVKLSTNKVQFISVGSQFSKLRDITVSESCGDSFGMVYHAEKLWLSVGRDVAVYDTSGKLLKTISNEVNGKRMFKSDIQQMTVHGDTIIVADGSDGAVCLDKDGTFKRELKDERLENTHGVCVSSDGSVFIAGYNSQNIILFDSDGKCLEEFVIGCKDFDPIDPTSLLLHEKRNGFGLVVGCHSNKFKVYDI